MKPTMNSDSKNKDQDFLILKPKKDKKSKKTKKLIKKVIKDFDFKRVQKVMTLLEWTWDFQGTRRIPSIDELKENAKQLLEGSITKSTTISTGGFRATYEDEILTLEFVLTETSKGDF